MMSICIMAIATLSYLVAYFYFGVVGHKKDLDTWARQTNNLNIERDFRVYSAILKSDMSSIRDNLELNFMFHLTAIEKDGIYNALDMDKIARICKLYTAVKIEFNKNYINKYPSAIKDLDKACR